MKWIIFLLFLRLILIKNKCIKYSCDQSKINVNEECSKIVDNGEMYILSKCGNYQYCPFLIDNPKCRRFNKKFKKYINGNCSNNDECFEGLKCEEDICVNSIDTDLCTDHSNCKIGEFCNKVKPEDSIGKCERQSDTICKNDFECFNDHGCLNGKCIEYFSLDDNSEVGILKEDQGIYSFCKSGYVLDNHCRKLKLNTDKECKKGEICHKDCTSNSNCSYQYEFESRMYNKDIPEYCDCGYNSQGNKYCKILYDENLIKTYKDTILQLLSNKNCHTLERKYCSYVFETNSYFHSYFLNIHRLTYETHMLVNSEECVEKSIYPVHSIKSQNTHCPTYSCLTSSEITLKSKFPNTCYYKKEGDFNEFQVVFISECQSDYYCDLDSYQMSINNNDEYTAFCKQNTNNLSYPGEMCEKNTDCIEVISINEKKPPSCVDFKCVGSNLNDVCKNNSNCVVGLFCEIKIGEETGKCKKLKAKGETCNNFYECENHLFCYNKSCIEFFSLEIGTLLDDKIPIKFYNYVCSSNFSYGNKCSILAYEDESKSEYGYIKCNLNENCKYYLLNEKLENNESPFDYETIKKHGINHTQTCTCGYNRYRNGYCPIDHINNYNRDKHQSFIDYRKQMFRNNCHTLNRLCKEKQILEDLKVKTIDIEESYFNSVECAIDVFYNFSKLVQNTAVIYYILLFIF